MSVDQLEKQFAQLSVKTCGALMTKGRRKGQECNKSIVPGSIRCIVHAEKQTCPMIRTKGIKKTERCNRVVIEDSGLCRVHLGLEREKPPRLDLGREHDVVVVGTTVMDKNKRFVFVNAL